MGEMGFRGRGSGGVVSDGRGVEEYSKSIGGVFCRRIEGVGRAANTHRRKIDGLGGGSGWLVKEESRVN